MFVAIPIYDENRTPWRSLIPLPLVTYALLIINIAVFLKMALMNSAAQTQFVLVYGLVPHDLFRIFDVSPARIPYHMIPLLTSMFLHGSLFHLIGNMLFLYIYGDNIEARIGHFRYLIFYILSGVVSALGHAIPFSQSMIPMVGASGAISGILGAYFILFPKARIVFLVWFFIIIRTVAVPALLVLGFWFIGQIMASLNEVSNVAWYAHICGFIFGILFALFGIEKGLRPTTR